MSNALVSRLPAFNDNYLWMIRGSSESRKAWAVDPGDADVIEQWLEANACQLAGILVTHHHPDHIGGVAQLKDKHTCPVVGPAFESRLSELLTKFVEESDIIDCDGLKAIVLQVHGHTSSHIAFHFEAQGQLDKGALFCGDSLFSLGCGRMFEGTPEQMWASLEKLRELPDDTLVYCAHEYTASNAKFALHVDPDNGDLASYAKGVFERRTRNEATVPSLLADEKKVNPFLRSDVIGSRLYPIPKDSNLSVNAHYFASLRKAKDNFAG